MGGSYRVDTLVSTYLLRVFVDANGNYGDPASVVIDEGKHIADAERQGIARSLATGETIFVNDLSKANISVIHPQGEIGFAGVGVLGAAWLLTELRSKPTETMQGRDGDIKIWQEGDVTWASASLSTMPPWNYKQLDNVEAVERIALEETTAMQHTMVWAWIDEAKGLIRARTFASDWDIPEAEGNGSGSMVLAAKLKRDIEIKHGEGSAIFAKPADSNSAGIGGRVIDDQFAHDSDEFKKVLLIHGGKLSDEIDKLERSSESHTLYYGYLKDFLINSGSLCDDILRAAANDAVLLSMIGTRVLFEDTINIHYLESKKEESERMSLAENWLKISNDPNAQKGELDGKAVADRAKAAGKDVRQLYYKEYALFCNYTHSTAQRVGLNIPKLRALGAKKAVLASLQAYANILTCVARIVGEEKPKEVTDTATAYFDKYRETVAQASLPIDESSNEQLA